MSGVKKLFGELFVRFYGPLHGRALKSLAYGSWGPLQPLIIRSFQRSFKIEWDDIRRFKNLGEFFLRKVPLQIGSSELVSPAQSVLIDCAEPIRLHEKVTVKGLTYQWENFEELDLSGWTDGKFWNFYLSPQHYHWVHAPAKGTDLRAYRTRGKKWPVNRLGRYLCPALYVENDRLTFAWNSPDWGQIYMICVGAMGVSSLRSVKGEVPEKTWTSLSPTVEKGESLLAFELGSTVLLLIERPPSSTRKWDVVDVGNDL